VRADRSAHPQQPDRGDATPLSGISDGADKPDAPATTLLEQMGGLSGLIYSSVPILVFVPANSLWNLTVAIYAALATALVIFLVRLVRHEPIQPAISGVIGVAICAFIAHRTGSAKGFFLFGIWTTLLYAGVFVASIVVRWPLVGVIWNTLNGNGTDWRRHRRTLLAYDIATAIWAVLFGVRYLVQSFLYDHDQTGALAFARIAMGWPLTAAAAVATFLLVRWAHKHDAADQDSEAGHRELAAGEKTVDGADNLSDTTTPGQPDGISGQGPPVR
jgi:hypothetical protein